MSETATSKEQGSSKRRSRRSSRSSGVANAKELRGVRLGRILTRMGKVKREQVHEALEIQKKRRTPLGQLLIDLGYVVQQDVDMALAAQAGMAVIDLDDYDIKEKTIQLVSSEMALAYHVLPLQYDENKNLLTVALKSAENFHAMDDLKMLMGYEVKAVMAPAEQLEKRIDSYYGEGKETLSAIVTELSEDPNFNKFDIGGGSVDLEELISLAEDSKIRRYVNLVMMQAIHDHASDIHMEPFEDEFKLRCRADGTMYELVPPPRVLGVAIISRIKVMANLDIAEHRKPQDGRISLVVNGAPVELRVSILPTMFGESAVLRVLDRSNVSLDLRNVGMRENDIKEFHHLIDRPNGIIVVTGPTGSGKTTTLYSALGEINDEQTKILTVEDPVEYDIEGLIQVQVNPAVDLTFSRALRSFLRQDPDVVLVGETRDTETAQIAVEAALTGHLVFTTLHTNDAPSSIARLLDLGIESFLLTATVEGIVAQRLVRTICPRCKEAYTPSEEELMKLDLTQEDIKGHELFHGRGCDFCHHSGYKGRMAIFEIMVMNDALRDLITQDISIDQLREEARKLGMRTLRQSGMMALYDGRTTIEEVARETVIED